jgi:hypothetical protein
MGEVATIYELMHQNPDEQVRTLQGDVTVMMDRKDLREVIDVKEDDNELTHALEYWLNDELVHRSVHVQLKKNVASEGIAAMMGVSPPG